MSLPRPPSRLPPRLREGPPRRSLGLPANRGSLASVAPRVGWAGHPRVGGSSAGSGDAATIAQRGQALFGDRKGVEALGVLAQKAQPD